MDDSSGVVELFGQGRRAGQIASSVWHPDDRHWILYALDETSANLARLRDEGEAIRPGLGVELLRAAGKIAAELAEKVEPPA